jgi:molecular chaperone HscB
MSVDFHSDYFALFGLPVAFRIDESGLEAAYREVQGQVHPDRFAHLPDADKRRSMQWATRVNEGFRTLRKPLSRAQYLLELNGVDPGLETNTAMSPEFLMEQMEWREAVDEAREARDADELEQLHHRLRQQSRDMVAALAGALDDRQDYEAAAEVVRRMMFVERLQSEIDDALGALEN